MRQRALDQYRAGKDQPAWPSAEQDRLYEALRSDAAGEPMRAFIRDTWGADFLVRLLALPAATP